MSTASRLAAAESCFEKPSPRPRGANGKFLPKTPPAEFICPECLHPYWWEGTECTGLWDDDRNLLDHPPARVVPIGAPS